MLSPANGLQVLHLTAPAPFGGLETVVETLCGGLADHKVRASVVAVLERPEPNHPFVRALRNRGIEVLPLVVGTRNYLKEIREVSQLIDETNADLLHTHGHRSDVIGGLVASRKRLPAVSTLHGFMAHTWSGQVREWIQLRRLRRFDAVVGVSAGILERAAAAGIAPDRLHLVPNAWAGGAEPADRATARASLGLPEEAFVVGWVGRLSHEKGPDIFLEALARWGSNEAVGSVIGDGRDRSALEQRAEALGVQTQVRWHGVREDAARLMKAFDVLVLSSRTEGVPMVLLEAMHAGIPLIATSVGGVPSVVDSTQALLVPAESPDALVKALRELRGDMASARLRAQRAAHRLATQFAVEPWVNRYVEVYREVTGGR